MHWIGSRKPPIQLFSVINYQKRKYGNLVWNWKKKALVENSPIWMFYLSCEIAVKTSFIWLKLQMCALGSVLDHTQLCSRLTSGSSFMDHSSLLEEWGTLWRVRNQTQVGWSKVTIHPAAILFLLNPLYFLPVKATIFALLLFKPQIFCSVVCQTLIPSCPPSFLFSLTRSLPPFYPSLLMMKSVSHMGSIK